MIWAVILPPLGALFLGPRIGLIQLSVVLTAYLAWYLLDLIAPLPVSPEKVLGAGYHWFALSLVTTLASIASAHFVRSMRRTQAELDRVKEQRIEELDALVTQRTQELETVRSEIARDFHDEVGNRLAAIALMARRILGDHPELPQGSRQLLDQVAVQSQDVHREARDFVWAIDSRSDCLGEVMLQVLQQTESSFQRPGQELRLDAGIPEAWFNVHLRVGQGRQLLLILKEALGNAARHGANSPVHVKLHTHMDRVEIDIRNERKPLTEKSNGRGLLNIRERIQRLGGQVDFQTDSHFVVHLVLPFPPNGGGKNRLTELA
jgi:signal transduction histidine kinase